MREELTGTIRAAVLEELAAHGYGRMSIEAVARRAGVGKTTIYRRWDSKLQVVIDATSGVASPALAAPDSGSLTGDLRILLGLAAQALKHPLASQIIPDLLAEAARNPEIAATLQGVLRDTQQALMAPVIAQAQARGELGGEIDVHLALDLAIGPLYWRMAVVRAPLPAGYLDQLAARTAAALAGPG